MTEARCLSAVMFLMRRASSGMDPMAIQGMRDRPVLLTRPHVMKQVDTMTAPTWTDGWYEAAMILSRGVMVKS